MKQTEISEPKFAEEIHKMPYEELLPIEKKLIAWSLVLGVAFIVLFVTLSHYLLRS